MKEQRSFVRNLVLGFTSSRIGSIHLFSLDVKAATAREVTGIITLLLDSFVGRLAVLVICRPQATFPIFPRPFSKLSLFLICFSGNALPPEKMQYVNDALTG